MSEIKLSSSIREAVRNEGPFLLSSFIEKVSALEATHQSSSSYGSKKKIRELISQSWQIANENFYDFYDFRTNAEYRQKEYFDFAIRFFKDVLGFKQVSKQSQKITIDEREFPINYLFDNIPVLIVDPSIDFDKQPLVNFGDRGRKRTAGALMQEFLNATDEYLYGVVFNGVKIRLLRDNPSLTRPAFIEVDLERVFDDQIYSDFTLFYLLFHSTRFKAPDNETFNCIFEIWRAEAYETGERALDTLRDGVKKALKALGNGFLKHQKNSSLYQDFNEAKLNETEYFQELLVIIYRLLFLLVVEDRNLLVSKDASKETRERYYQGYSISKLRDLAYKKKNYDNYDDLYQALELVFNKLDDGSGTALGLTGLGGMFKSNKTKFINGLYLQNSYLLEAIYHIGYFKKEKHTIKINYRDMNTEELGSVYESLLELQPQINIAAGEFVFVGEEQDIQDSKGKKSKRGSERKTTGSYYTPDSLVQQILKTALDPVIKDTIKKNPQDPITALLNLRIIDPACGSGHFLLAAARKLAAELALIKAGEDSPTEEHRREALHEVIGKCIYGVDKNKLSIELCKSALWIEAAIPGKSLNFLDHHIKNGDSLVGVFDLNVLKQGIPDEAYKAILDDDKKLCSELKKRNKEERDGQRKFALFVNLEDSNDNETALVALANLINQASDTNLIELEKKEQLFTKFKEDQNYRNLKNACDLWTATFFCPKQIEGDINTATIASTADVKALLAHQSVADSKIKKAQELSQKYKFFHWQIEFPDIFLNGKQGFDVVLGNPPWAKVKLKDKDFFKKKDSNIAFLTNKSKVKKAIEKLKKETPSIMAEYNDALYYSLCSINFISKSGFKPLTAVGDLNFYPLFTELGYKILNLSGKLGVIIPAGIMTDDTTKKFFDDILCNQKIVCCYEFENRERFFDILSHNRFCLLTLSSAKNQEIEFIYGAFRVSDLLNPDKKIKISPDDIKRLNPNTKTSPIFNSKKDAELTLSIYKRVPVLINENDPANGNPWGISFMSMFHMSNDSHLFIDTKDVTNTDDSQKLLPLYEGKMIDLYDHRYSSFDIKTQDFKNITEERKNPLSRVEPQYFLKEEDVLSALKKKEYKYKYLFGYRTVSNSATYRNLISSILPMCGVGNSMCILLHEDASHSRILSLYCNFSSIVLDYILRQKMGGKNINVFHVKQLPILPRSIYSTSDIDFIKQRALELYYTSEDLRGFAEDHGYTGPPFKWDSERRAILQAELDAYYAKLYGLTREELQFILDPADVMGEHYPTETFRVLKNNENKRYGEYRTKRLVLEAWDRIHSEVKDELAVV
jgi:hypothetical protein